MDRRHVHRSALVVGGLFALLGALGVIGSWAVFVRDTKIIRGGGRATAHITDKQLVFAADGDSDYVIEYWFQAPSGERVVSRRGVDEALWRSTAQGATIAIAYSPASPQHNLPVGSAPSLGLALFISAFCAVFVLFGGLLVAGACRPYRSAVRPRPVGEAPPR